jgi:hypothetical protein
MEITSSPDVLRFRATHREKFRETIMLFANRDATWRKLLPAALALVGSTVSFALTSAPVHAANGQFYAATLSRPMDGAQKIIQKGVLWKCEGANCSAPRDTSRPVMVCARLVQKVGPVTRFATPQGELAPEDLARCNESAAN